ncbi:MAG: hypothetical protein N2C14_23590, partial [Planctomycetales bacterium]
FYLLTGRPLYPKRSLLATMKSHADKDVPRLPDYLPDDPPQMQFVLERAVAKRPKDRYRAVADFMKDLQLLLDRPSAVREGSSRRKKVKEKDAAENQAPESKPSDGKKKKRKKKSSKRGKRPRKTQWAASVDWCQATVRSDAFRAFAAPVGCGFPLFLAFCWATQPHCSAAWIFLQALVGGLLSGSAWFHREALRELGDRHGWKIGAALGASWGLAYGLFDFPYALELGGATLSAWIPPVAGVVVLGALLGCGLGRIKKWGSLVTALGVSLPAASLLVGFGMWFTMDADDAVQRAVMFREQERTSRALAHFSYAIGLDPANADAYRERSRLHQDQGRVNEAISDALTAARVGSRNPDNHQRLAEAYEQVGSAASAKQARAREKKLRAASTAAP